MGQSQSKPPGALAFGHVAYLDPSSSPATDKHDTPSPHDKDAHQEDRLLSLPQQYGLSVTSPCSSNTNNSARYQYRPCTPPTPPTPLSFNFSSASASASASSYPSSSSSSSYSLFTSLQAKDHMDNNVNNNNDNLSTSDWLTLMNDVTYVDTTYYHKAAILHNGTQRGDYDQNPLPPLPPSVTITEKSLTTTDLQSIDKTMHVISLAQQNLIRLNPNIGLFTMICKLDLTNNKLTCLPDSIGHLTRLESLYVGSNQLDALPDTIGHLTKLIELDVSHNQLTSITPCIAYLKKLQVLVISQNLIHELPVHLVVGLKGLTILDLSDNPISVLPAEITQLHFLRRLLLDGCPLVDPSMMTAASSSATTLLLSSTSTTAAPSRIRKPPCYTLLHSPPSLLEQCARTIVRDTKRHVYYQQRFYKVPQHLVTYLFSAAPCTLCQGPYFDTYVARGRHIERNGRWFPVEYRLCRTHFTTEDDRLLSMFSTEGASSIPTPSPTKSSDRKGSASSLSCWNQPYRPSLPTLPKLSKRQSSPSLPTQDDHHQYKRTSLNMESVIQQQQQDQLQLHTQDDTRLDLFNNSGWRAHRMKVMNKNQSGFLTLTKATHANSGSTTATPHHHQV